MSKSQPRFEFYEEVIIRSHDSLMMGYDGKTGVVLGRVEAESRPGWYYTVGVDNLSECACFYEYELESTGRILPAEDFV